MSDDSDTLSILWSRDPLEFSNLTAEEKEAHIERIVNYYKQKYQTHRITGKPAAETKKIDLVALGLMRKS